ncbi:MAG: SH3-like domain-containing protein [Alphaproteobacteria bacterium]
MTVLKAKDVERVVKMSGSGRIEKDVPAKFKPGDWIVTRDFEPKGHTRLPRYVRGKRGVVERDHGVYVFPDTNAVGGPANPQHVYNVRFDFHEIWGKDAEANAVLHIDLWDDYMEIAE